MIQNSLVQDDRITTFINDEAARQATSLNFIASENYTSAPIRRAAGSVLTNKYAEGYPGKRYYAGCEIVDEIETLAIQRCTALFGADAANVQPHSGSSANMGVYSAFLKPGDTILGMSLNSGGHLTHGHPVNISGMWYKAIHYGVHPETELLDFDEIERLAHEHRPKLMIAGASAYSRIINFAQFSQIARDIGAYSVADIAHIAGLVAAGLHPSPVPFCDIITSTTHKTLRGPRGGLIMSKEQYGEQINRAMMPGLQGGPLMNIIAGKAICFYEAAQPEFITYQKQICATAHRMATAFQQHGYRIVAGGTDNHLFIVDLSDTTYSGLAAEKLLASIGITVSRSCIPNDTKKPWITSGIRFGTAAMTTRGMDETTVEEIVDLIHAALQPAITATALQSLAQQVLAIAVRLPVPE